MTNKCKVFNEKINVSGSEKFFTVREAVVELNLHTNQIRHLISQNLIDYKLENGSTLVNVNSIDPKVMNDLKKEKNFYPLRKNYKLNIDKEVVINSIIDNINNSSNKESLECKKDFENLCGSYDIKYDDLKIQSFIHKILSKYHTDKNSYKNHLFNYSVRFVCDIYTIVSMEKEDNKSEYGFYFLDTKKYVDSVDKIRTSVTLEDFLNNTGNIYYVKLTDNYHFRDTHIKYVGNKISKYIYENHLFYLTLDEFIKEFSPKKYYEKNKLWSMYLDKTEYVAEEAANDEEIKQLYTVNGFERNQPYGSRKNPQYKKIWIDPFQRGGKKS